MKEYSAGGVVYKKQDGNTKILLIQDRFGKITLPKGHVEEGETEKDAAVREVFEETGIQAEIEGDPLGVISFQFETSGKGMITKQVTYYLMRAVSGDTKAQVEEIKDVIWLPLDDVLPLHTKQGYDNNHVILERAVNRLRGERR
ncbi:NUDIX hydrolase [Effusibacillus dendaii]|uniref:Nudix hydrolase domain-containing protein n=1 Tax=Effusibacillus dendaii TaxID=2743772 RepID=A0A7I8D893_9BACL|nr:NUDIX domain-containing protein [Effusibacillus dendaii]BCJ86237.1 hypothetical protein skT53_12220 [Effusibacillus dendaii]